MKVVAARALHTCAEQDNGRLVCFGELTTCAVEADLSPNAGHPPVAVEADRFPHEGLPPVSATSPDPWFVISEHDV